MNVQTGKPKIQKQNVSPSVPYKLKCVLGSLYPNLMGFSSSSFFVCVCVDGCVCFVDQKNVSFVKQINNKSTKQPTSNTTNLLTDTHSTFKKRDPIPVKSNQTKRKQKNRKL